jgi:hypothetical protein
MHTRISDTVSTIADVERVLATARGLGAGDDTLVRVEVEKADPPYAGIDRTRLVVAWSD